MDQGVRWNLRHVTFPALLRRERGDGGCELYQPGHATSLDVEPESRELVEAILEGFETPRTVDAFLRAQDGIPADLVTLLVRSGFVVEEDELDFLQHGFMRPVPVPVGEAWSFSDLPELAYPGGFVVVGVPVDMGSLGPSGARHGPSEIRKVVNGPLLTGQGDIVDYEFGRLYPQCTPQISDLGDIEPDGARMDHVGLRLRKVLRELLQRHMRPLVLGGDHSVTHYVLAETISQVERFGILHFDAHADMGPSHCLSHANIFAEAIASPNVEHIVQIGLRGMERLSPFAQRISCPKRTVVSARESKLGKALAVLEALPRDIPYYLSFDIDCIEPSVAPETGTPSSGGISATLATELVDYIARTFELLGADFVEVSSSGVPPNRAAHLAAELLQRCVLGQSRFEPLSTDVYQMR